MPTDSAAGDMHTLTQATQSHVNEVHATVAHNVENGMNILDTNQERASTLIITQVMVQSKV